MNPQSSPFTFREISDQFRGVESPLDLRSFATMANAVSAGSPYQAAVDNPFGLAVKKASVALDRGLEWTGLPDSMSNLFGDIGEVFGAREGGLQAGRNLPRAALDFLPAIVGSAFGPIGFGVGLAGSSLMSAMNAYEKTDSPGEAAWAGATVPLSVAIGGIGGKAAVGAMSKLTGGKIGMEVVEGLGKLPKNWATTATELTGSTAAAEGAFLAESWRQSGWDPEFWNRDNVFQTIAEELPFTLLDVMTTKTPASARAKKLVRREQESIHEDDVAPSSVPTEPVPGPQSTDFSQLRFETKAHLELWYNKERAVLKQAKEDGFIDEVEQQEAETALEDRYFKQTFRLNESLQKPALKDTLLGMKPEELADIFIDMDDAIYDWQGPGGVLNEETAGAFAQHVQGLTGDVLDPAALVGKQRPTDFNGLRDLLHEQKATSGLLAKMKLTFEDRFKAAVERSSIARDEVNSDMAVVAKAAIDNNVPPPNDDQLRFDFGEAFKDSGDVEEARINALDRAKMKVHAMVDSEPARLWGDEALDEATATDRLFRNLVSDDPEVREATEISVVRAINSYNRENPGKGVLTAKEFLALVKSGLVEPKHWTFLKNVVKWNNSKVGMKKAEFSAFTNYTDGQYVSDMYFTPVVPSNDTTQASFGRGLGHVIKLDPTGNYMQIGDEQLDMSKMVPESYLLNRFKKLGVNLSQWEALKKGNVIRPHKGDINLRQVKTALREGLITQTLDDEGGSAFDYDKDVIRALAPDEYDQYDPESGTGNVTVVVSVKGLDDKYNYNPHTSDQNALGWVRGKVIKDNDKRIFRIDELQSDVAQRYSKQLAFLRNADRFEVTKWFDYTDIKFVSKDEEDVVHFDIPKEIDVPDGMTLDEAKVLALDHLETNVKHPFYDNANQILLRNAFLKAAELGVDEVMLPDSNTVRLSERHVEVGRRPNEANIQKLLLDAGGVKQVTPGEYHDVVRIKGADGRQLLWYLQRKDGSIIHNGFINSSSYPDSELFSLGLVNRSDTESGMMAHYGSAEKPGALMNIAEKLTGDKGTPFSYGKHKQSHAFSISGVRYPVSGFLSKLTSETTGRPNERPQAYQLREALKINLARLGFKPTQMGPIISHVEQVANVLNVTPEGWGVLLDNNSEAFSVAGMEMARKIYLGAVDSFKNLPREQQIEALSYVVAHEQMHVLQRMAREGKLNARQQEAYQKFNEWFKLAPREEQNEVMDVLIEAYGGGMDVSDLKTQMMDHENAEAAVTGLLAVGMSRKKEGADQTALGMIPRVFTKWMSVVNVLRTRMIKSLKTAMGMEDGWVDSKKHVTDLLERFESLQEALKETEGLHYEFSKFGNIHPETYSLSEMTFDDFHRGRIGDTLLEFASVRDKPQDVVDTVMAQMRRWFEHTNRLAERTPGLRGAAIALLSHQPNANAMANQFMAPKIGGQTALNAAGGLKRGLNKSQAIRDYERALSDPKINPVLSNMMRVYNEARDKGTTPTIADLTSHADVQGMWSKLTKEDQQLVQQQFLNHIESAKLKNQAQIDKSKDLSLWSIARVLSAKAKDVTDHTKAYHISGAFMEWARAAKAQDARAMGIAESLIEAQYPTSNFVGIGNSTPNFENIALVNSTKKLAENMLAIEEEVQKRFGGDPAFSDMRVGRFLVEWFDKSGKASEMKFDTQKEAMEFSKSLGVKTTITDLDRSKRKQDVITLRSDLVDFLRKLDTMREDAIDRTNATQDVKDELKTASRYVEGYLEALKGTKGVNEKRYRNKAGGKEYINYVDVQRIHDQVFAKALADLEMNIRMKYELSHPELKRFSDQKIEFEERVAEYKRPDPRIAQAMAKLNFIRFMGLNFPSHFSEAFQSLFTTWPQLVSWEGKPLQSFKMMMDSAKEVNKAVMKMLKGESDNAKLWDDPEFAKVAGQAAHDGKIGYSYASDVLDNPAGEAYQIGTLKREGKLAQAGDVLMAPLNLYGRAATNVFGAVSRYNSRIALHIGWKLAKKKLPHLNPQFKPGDPDTRIFMEEVYRFLDLATFGGGRANRSLGPYKHLGKGVGVMAMSLQGFNTGVLGMMMHNAQTAFAGKKYGHITPADRKKARQALAAQTMTFFGASGLMGMPFVGAAIAAIEDNTDLELHAGIREWMGKVIEDPDLQDMILHGVTNKWIFGADISSRFSIGGLPGTDAYRGFNPSAIYGPFGSTINDFFRAVKVMSEGGRPFSDRMAEAGEYVLPVALKKMVNLARHGGEFRDLDGNLLPGGTTTAKVLYGMGFTQTEVRRMKETERMLRRTRELQRLEDKRFHEYVAELFLQDPAAALSELKNKAEDSTTGYTVEEGARRVAEKVEARVFPKSIHDDASMSSAAREAKILRSTQQASNPQLVERLDLRRIVAETLAPGSSNIDGKDYAKARMVQELMLQNPFMTKAEAQALIEKQARQIASQSRSGSPFGLRPPTPSLPTFSVGL